MTRDTRTTRRIHPFEAYADRTGHYPTARVGGVKITVNPSYITLDKHFHPVYIPRDTLIPLLQWLIPLARRMEGSFDPDLAMSDYLAEQTFYDAAIKQERKRRGV